MTTKKTEFWNGKNLAGKTHAGVEGLISEGRRTSLTQSKYQVSNDTVSADDLQPSPHSSIEATKSGG